MSTCALDLGDASHVTCGALAEDSAEDEKIGRKSPCHTATEDENDDESQSFHSSRPLNRRSLSLVSSVVAYSIICLAVAGKCFVT